ncbi:MAG: tetratricopeptide repeat protein, partial [Gammaproteobacteria bacterium]|nr:tetratricopeptide repeat protein [Gammaproteobacteria bacterium]
MSRHTAGQFSFVNRFRNNALVGLWVISIGSGLLHGCNKSTDQDQSSSLKPEHSTSLTKPSNETDSTLSDSTSLAPTAPDVTLTNLPAFSTSETPATLATLSDKEQKAFLAIAMAANKKLSNANLNRMYHAYATLKNELTTHISQDAKFQQSSEIQKVNLDALSFENIKNDLTVIQTSNNEDNAARFFWLGLVHQTLLSPVKADEYYLKAAAISLNPQKLQIYIGFIKENFPSILPEQYVQNRLEQTIELHNRTLGKHHPDAAIFINALGDYFLQNKQFALAEEYYERALSIWERSFSPGSEQLNAQYERLIKIYITLKSYSKAETLITRVLEHYETSLSNSDPKKLNTMDLLASIYVLQEKYEQAEPLYEKTLNQWNTLIDEEDPIRVPHLNNLADVYLKL